MNKIEMKILGWGLILCVCTCTSMYVYTFYFRSSGSVSPRRWYVSWEMDLRKDPATKEIWICSDKDNSKYRGSEMRKSLAFWNAKKTGGSGTWRAQGKMV